VTAIEKTQESVCFFDLFESQPSVKKAIFAYNLSSFFDSCGYSGPHPEIVQVSSQELEQLNLNQSKSGNLLSVNDAELSAFVLAQAQNLTKLAQLGSNVIYTPFEVKAVLESSSSRKDPITGVKAKTSAYYALSSSAFNKLMNQI